MSEARKLAFVACIQIIVSLLIINASEGTILGTTYDAHPALHMLGVCAFFAALVEIVIAGYMALTTRRHLSKINGPK